MMMFLLLLHLGCVYSILYNTAVNLTIQKTISIMFCALSFLKLWSKYVYFIIYTSYL